MARKKISKLSPPGPHLAQARISKTRPEPVFFWLVYIPIFKAFSVSQEQRMDKTFLKFEYCGYEVIICKLFFSSFFHRNNNTVFHFPFRPEELLLLLVMGSGQARARQPEADFLKSYSIDNFWLIPKARQPEAIFLSPARPEPDFFQPDRSLVTNEN